MPPQWELVIVTNRLPQLLVPDHVGVKMGVDEACDYSLTQPVHVVVAAVERGPAASRHTCEVAEAGFSQEHIHDLHYPDVGQAPVTHFERRDGDSQADEGDGCVQTGEVRAEISRYGLVDPL